MGFQFLGDGPARAAALGPRRITLGYWRASSVAANTTATPGRATGQATAAQVPFPCRIVGFTCANGNLGVVVPVAGSALVFKAIRVPLGGVADAPVTIGSMLVGESNVSKPASGITFPNAGELVYVQFVTDISFTSTTIAPSFGIEVEAT